MVTRFLWRVVVGCFVNGEPHEPIGTTLQVFVRDDMVMTAFAACAARMVRATTDRRVGNEQ